MMSKPTSKTILLIMLSCIVAINGSGCGTLKKPSQKQEKSSSQSESKKPPKELDQLKKTMDKIEASLSSIHEKNKIPMFIQQQEQQGKQQQGGKTGSSSDSSSGSGGGSESGGSTQPSPTPTITMNEVKLKQDAENFKTFDSLKRDMKTLHSTWNSYEPTAVSDLAKPTIMKEFEDTLGTLTKSIESQDLYMSLVDINQLNKYLPDFYELYKTETPPDLDKLKFALKKIKLVNEKKDYETEKSILKYLNEVWAVLKPKLKKDNMEMINKFEFAVTDLKNAVEAKNNTLIEAKADVMINLINNTQKKMKE